MEKGNKPNRLLWILGGAAVAAFLIILGLYIAYFKNLSVTNDSATWRTFGDYLGGTLNPIISFLALIGLLYTIHQQAQEMQATREELKQAAEQQRQQVEQQSRQSEIFNLQQFESTFFSLLEQHNKIIEKIDFYYFFNSIKSNYQILINTRDIIKEKPPKNLSNSYAAEIINKNILNELKQYLNILFQILKFIAISLSKDTDNEQKINIKDFSTDSALSRDRISKKCINPQEKIYSDIIRSLLPNECLKFLALNCLTIDEVYQNDELKTFYNLQGLLNRYALLELLQLDLDENHRIPINQIDDRESDHVIHFLTLTSIKDIKPAFGSNILAKKLEFKFKDKLNFWLIENTTDKKHQINLLEETNNLIIRIRSISEYDNLTESEKLRIVVISSNPSTPENFNGDFNIWKERCLETLENNKQLYEKNINEINTELKRLEKNKKAWLEFLQIEDN